MNTVIHQWILASSGSDLQLKNHRQKSPKLCKHFHAALPHATRQCFCQYPLAITTNENTPNDFCELNSSRVFRRVAFKANAFVSVIQIQLSPFKFGLSFPNLHGTRNLLKHFIATAVALQCQCRTNTCVANGSPTLWLLSPDSAPGLTPFHGVLGSAAHTTGFHWLTAIVDSGAVAALNWIFELQDCLHLLLRKVSALQGLIHDKLHEPKIKKGYCLFFAKTVATIISSETGTKT